MNWAVPLADVQLGKEEEDAVLSVMRSGWLTMGAVTQAFEAEFASFSGSRFAFGVTNATAALHMACLAVGVEVGDEVIVPSLSFVASANAIAYTGAKPVFADIEGLSWPTVSAEAVEKAITNKTKAIMVMHYAGYPCDMPAILDVARAHGLRVIEDAAHAVGASLQGKALGTWGDVGCFSFFGNKNLTTGEGGMLLTDDSDLAEKLKLLRSHGMTTLTWDRHQGHASTYDVVALGYNYRIDEIRSAIGRVQLGRIPAGNQRRAELVALYRVKLGETLPELAIPFTEGRGQSSYHIMPVLLPPGVPKQPITQQMKEQAIQTSWHYPLIHQFSIYQEPRSDLRQSLPFSEEFSQRELTLPLYPGMTDLQLQLVVYGLAKSMSGQG